MIHNNIEKNQTSEKGEFYGLRDILYKTFVETFKRPSHGPGCEDC